MKLFEIKVYRPKVKLDPNQLPHIHSIDEIFNNMSASLESKVEIGSEIQKKNAVYYSEEYTKRAKCFVQIGIEIEAHRIEIKGMPEIQFVQSPQHKNLWYELSNVWYEDGFVTWQSANFGMNACGRFIVEAYDVNDVLIAQEIVVVYPQTMSFEQYETMQAEVRELFRILDTRPGTSENEREILGPLFPLDIMEQHLHDLRLAIDEIIDAPMESLKFEKMLLAPEQIKRWTSRTLIERERQKGQPKIRAEVALRHTNIPEHQMIRTILEKTLEMLQQAETIERSKLTSLEGEKIMRRSTLMVRKEESGVAEALQRRYRQTVKELERFQDRTVRLNRLVNLIDSMLSNELFEGPAIDIDETHLFIHDMRYNEVFELYESIQSLMPQLNPRKQEFIQQMTYSPLLFEVWTLLQLCRELEKLRFRTAEQSVTDLLLAYYERRVTLSGVELQFVHIETKDQIWLAYEREVFLKKQKNEKRKPDFLLSYAVGGLPDRRNLHVLDAKYKPYGIFNQSVLYKDFVKSAKRYIDDFLKEGHSIQSAALVHSDVISDTYHWNAQIDPGLYAYSHFPIAPGQNDHLNTYIKRILHHYNGRHEICPSCGCVTEGIPTSSLYGKRPYKWTYICKCDEVWVNNRCKYRENHVPILQEMRLLKYATGNYNWQVDQGWDVHCPVCNKSYHGDFYNPGLFGRKERIDDDLAF